MRGDCEVSDTTPEASGSAESYWIGQELDWDASPIPVVLFVELPFWLMVPDGPFSVPINGHEFRVEVRSGLLELHAGQMCDSRASCVYVGPDPSRLDPEIQREIDEQQVPVVPRKCKTVLRIHTRCNGDVLSAAGEEGGGRLGGALQYLKSLCEAHLPVVNGLVQHYRMATYDYFPYEVSPWDVPVWFVETSKSFTRVVLFRYAEWDHKPRVGDWGESRESLETYTLVAREDLQEAMALAPGPGELELLDALNLMGRGDFSGAVRRITTAIEAMAEFVLREELLKNFAPADVEKKLAASRNDFPGRLRQYEKLSTRALPPQLAQELEDTRDLRHAIVHRAARITFGERGRAQRSVDTGRWIYNWLENRPDRRDVREKRIGLRSIGRHFSLYDAEITTTAVVVHKPPVDEDE